MWTNERFRIRADIDCVVNRFCADVVRQGAAMTTVTSVIARENEFDEPLCDVCGGADWHIEYLLDLTEQLIFRVFVCDGCGQEWWEI